MSKSRQRQPRFSGGRGHRLGRLEAPGGRRARTSLARSGQERKVGSADERKSSLCERAQAGPLIKRRVCVELLLATFC